MMSNIGIEISVYIQIFIPVKASFIRKEIQQSGLIIEIMI